MKTTFLILLILTTYTSAHSVQWIEPVRDAAVAYWNQIKGSSYVLDENCLASYVEDDFKVLINYLKQRDFTNAYNQLKKIVRDQYTHCPIEDTKQVIRDIKEAFRTGAMAENAYNNASEIRAIIEGIIANPPKTIADLAIIEGKLTNILVYDRTTPPTEAELPELDRMRNLRGKKHHSIYRIPNFKALSPVDFIRGEIIGASDVDEASNQCLIKSKDTVDKLEVDISKIATDLQKFDFKAIFNDLLEIVNDISMDDTEQVCHFYALYNKLQNPLEIMKAGYAIIQHAQQFESLAQAAVTAFQAQDAKTAGVNVGAMLKLAFDFRTQ